MAEIILYTVAVVTTAGFVLLVLTAVFMRFWIDKESRRQVQERQRLERVMQASEAMSLLILATIVVLFLITNYHIDEDTAKILDAIAKLRDGEAK